MCLSLMFLLQEAPRLSKVVIVMASLALVVGFVLVVYFYKRFRATEKESQDDWQAGMHSLFVAPAAEHEQRPPEPSQSEPMPQRLASQTVDQSTQSIDEEGIVSRPVPVRSAPIGSTQQVTPAPE